MRLLSKTLLLLALASPLLQAATPTVKDGQVRQPMPGRSVTAGYFTLTNPSDTALQLVSAQSPLFARVELHQHSHKDGMMRMEQVSAIDIAAGATVELAPGGLHLMLFEPQAELAPGMPVPLTLSFAGGQQLQVELPVVAMPKR